MIIFYHHLLRDFKLYLRFTFLLLNPSFFCIWKQFDDAAFSETHSTSGVSLVVLPSLMRSAGLFTSTMIRATAADLSAPPV